jgi:hypothetical protein
MPTHPDSFRETIAHYEPRLRAISDSSAAANPRGGDAWSRKQEMGHLIDSATNNRVRFVRAALEGKYAGPSYDGVGWVRVGGYAEMPWTDIIDLWKALNLALAVLVGRIPEDRLPAKCHIGDDPEVTLDFIITDYVRHMRQHLDHVLL